MKKGDFVKVSYTGRVDGELIETTDEKTAKKEDAYDEKRQYEPAVVIVGEGMVLPGLDKGLEKLKVGEKKKLELEAKDAFGERSFKLIKLVPMRDFKKQNVSPFPGMVLQIEGRPAKIQSVSSGRVRVDFNHPLAGKEVEYELKVEAQAKTERDKIGFLLERDFRDDSLEFKTSGKKGEKKLIVKIPEETSKDKYYPVMKAVFKADAEKYLDVKEVEYEEPGKKEEDKKTEKKAKKKPKTSKKKS